MKKESAAERALNTQIKRVANEEVAAHRDMEKLRVKASTLLEQREALEAEVSRLRKQREHASETRKP